MSFLEMTENCICIGYRCFPLIAILFKKMGQKKFIRWNYFVSRTILIVVNHIICRVGSPSLGMFVVCRSEFLLMEFIELAEMVDIDFGPTYQLPGF